MNNSELKAQLAGAVGLLRELRACNSRDSWPVLIETDAFLARHAQAEQQEAHGAQAGDDYRLPLEEIAERQAFNKWRVDGIDGCNCSPAAAAWLAWQARAALATQSEVPEQYEYWCIAHGCWRPIQKLVHFLTARGFKVRAVRGAEHE